MEEMNKALIEEALRITNGSQIGAARLLKITWRQFDNRVRRYGLRHLTRAKDSK
jgi:transcriptional regulator with GAF, ATPase, and Fis domain